MLYEKKSWHKMTHEEDEEGKLPELRQLFLTAGGALSSHVRRHYQRLLKSDNPFDDSEDGEAAAAFHGEAGGRRREQELPESYLALLDHPLPIFATFDKLCQMLDAALPPERCFHPANPEQRRRALLRQVAYKRFKKVSHDSN
jgi:hypothetical protein